MNYIICICCVSWQFWLTNGLNGLINDLNLSFIVFTVGESHFRFVHFVSSIDFLPKSSQSKLSSRFFGLLKLFALFEYLGLFFFSCSTCSTISKFPGVALAHQNPHLYRPMGSKGWEGLEAPIPQRKTWFGPNPSPWLASNLS